MSVSILIFISWIQISWTKKNGLLDSGQKLLLGSTYTMTNISQYQAGVYICEASNGVGHPVLQHINLTVLCEYSCEIPDTSLFRNSLFFILYPSFSFKYAKENIKKIETNQPKRKVDCWEKKFLALTNCTFMSNIRQRSFISFDKNNKSYNIFKGSIARYRF